MGAPPALYHERVRCGERRKASSLAGQQRSQDSEMEAGGSQSSRTSFAAKPCLQAKEIKPPLGFSSELCTLTKWPKSLMRRLP